MFLSKIAYPLSERLVRTNNRPAFYIKGKFYSYSQLGERVNAIRAFVRTRHSALFGLMAYDDIDTYASILALWLEGRGYVPLHPLQPVDRLNNIIGQVGLETVLTPEKETEGIDVLTIPTRRMASEGVAQLPYNISDSQTAYILFTSGSTGKPKGVPITRGNVVAWTEAFEALNLKLSEDDRCLQMFDLTFDLSVGSYLPALLHGACLYTVSPGTVKYQEVFALMDDHSLTEALMVPSVIHYLRPYVDELDDEAMRHCLFCGEALDADDAKAWRKAVPKARLWNVYGPTENTIYCTAYELTDNIKNVNGCVCIGKAMKNNLTAVFDDDGNKLTNGELGELCLSGFQLTPGYWQNDFNNRKSFFMSGGTRWYRTGDVCSVDTDDDILYYGRNDSQVKIQGFRVELGEIEHAAKEYFHGKRNAVAAAVDGGGSNMVVRLMIEGTAVDTTALKEFLSGKLPSYMLPHDIRFMEQFPQNANNKIDRKAIREMLK